jgi:hypothetical protein
MGYIDANFEANAAKMEADLGAAVGLVATGRNDLLVFPGSGLGTGVAGLPAQAPRTWRVRAAA